MENVTAKHPAGLQIQRHVTRIFGCGRRRGSHEEALVIAHQLRQRVAFALSEILVISDIGTLNNNGRILSDYYDTLLDNAFGNFRDLLETVTLTPAGASSTTWLA